MPPVAWQAEAAVAQSAGLGAQPQTGLQHVLGLGRLRVDGRKLSRQRWAQHEVWGGRNPVGSQCEPLMSGLPAQVCEGIAPLCACMCVLSCMCDMANVLDVVAHRKTVKR